MAFTPFDLTGKVALVTGGNGGIGLGMAEGLAAAGAKVAIWGQNPAKNTEAQKVLEALGGEVLVQAVDVTSEEAVVDGVAAVIERFGRLDFCAANAGIGGGAPFGARRAGRGGKGWFQSDAAIDFLRQGRRHLLIRINRQHPIPGGHGQRPVFLRPKAGPIRYRHPVGVAPANFHRGICAARIEHDDFIRESG